MVPFPSRQWRYGERRKLSWSLTEFQSGPSDEIVQGSHLHRERSLALSDGKAFDMEQWTFPNDEGTAIFYTNFLRRIWYQVQDAAKVRRRTPNHLRYSRASHMLSAGADLAYVSA
jgi:site-specific recombinase XerD